MAGQSLIDLPVTETAFNLLLEFAKDENRSPTDTVESLLLREKHFREVMRRSADAMARMQGQSLENGNANMTMEEIDEEIAASRRERAALKKSA